MTEPIAYLNGEFIGQSRIAISVHDLGFVQGVTISERMRTFRGRLYCCPEHLDRLRRSLEIAELDAGRLAAEVEPVAHELVAHNHRLLDAENDLALVLMITPGSIVGGPPTVCLHTMPLEFHQWSHLYEQGDRLIVSSIQQVPAACWPPELKCRSRVHYYLADAEARRADPLARAILLDGEGFVNEATTANVLAYLRHEGLVSPRMDKILPGISISTVQQLADELNIPMTYRDISVGELAEADELMLASTSPCLWPVTRLNGQSVGDGRPGEQCHRLLERWSARVGVDIVAQARKYA